MARRPIFFLPRMLFRLLTLSLAWPSAVVLAQTTSQDLDPFIATYAEAHGFHGTILVETGGKVRYERSFGLANLSFKAANTPQLLELFLSEARERLDFADTTLAVDGPGNELFLIMLLLSFNTLKGSARTVGLDVFADCAHAIVRVMNTWLAV